MKLTSTMFLTLDGVVQGPGAPDEDTSDGFTQGGWVVPHMDDDFFRFVNGVFERPEAFLLGRRTYDIFAAYWPRVTATDDPVATKLNGLPKYVVSRSLERADWQHTTILSGDIAKEIAELKTRPGGELQIHGSPTLVRSLMAHDLIDEFNLSIFPVVLGSGRRLFEPGTTPTGMRLIHRETTSTGVTIQTYAAAGRPTYGAFPGPE
jgi:dihydrofolate reductase